MGMLGFIRHRDIGRTAPDDIEDIAGTAPPLDLLGEDAPPPRPGAESHNSLGAGNLITGFRLHLALAVSQVKIGDRDIY